MEREVILLILTFAFIFCKTNAAPVFNDDFPQERECLYDGKLHGHGLSIETQDPCLNCTCNRGVLVCFLRMCPNLVSPPNSGCSVRKSSGVCCAELVCDTTDEKNTTTATTVQARIDSTVDFTVEGTEVTPFDFTSADNATTLDCNLDGSVFAEGSAMLSSSVCEYCYCIRGTHRCIRPQCHLSIDGCSPIYQSGLSCCPTAYECRHNVSSGDIVTTTSWTEPLEKSDCDLNGTIYKEGSVVSTSDVCSHCFCIAGSIKCSLITCPLQMDGCKPIIQSGKCCPTGYNCSADSQTTISPEDTDEPEWQTSFDSSTSSSITEADDDNLTSRDNDRIIPDSPTTEQNSDVSVSTTDDDLSGRHRNPDLEISSSSVPILEETTFDINDVTLGPVNSTPEVGDIIETTLFEQDGFENSTLEESLDTSTVLSQDIDIPSNVGRIAPAKQNETFEDILTVNYLTSPSTLLTWTSPVDDEVTSVTPVFNNQSEEVNLIAEESGVSLVIVNASVVNSTDIEDESNGTKLFIENRVNIELPVASNNQSLYGSLNSIVSSLLQTRTNDTNATTIVTNTASNEENLGSLIEDFVDDVPGELQFNTISYLNFNNNVETTTSNSGLNWTNRFVNLSVSMTSPSPEVMVQTSISMSIGEVHEHIPSIDVPESVSSIKDSGDPEPTPSINFPEPTPSIISVPEPTPSISVPEPTPSISVQEPTSSISVPEPTPSISVPEPTPSRSVPESTPSISVPEPSPSIPIPEDEQDPLTTFVESDLGTTMELILNLSKVYASMNMTTVAWKPQDYNVDDIMLKGNMPEGLEAKINEIVRLAQAKLNATEQDTITLDSDNQDNNDTDATTNLPDYYDDYDEIINETKISVDNAEHVHIEDTITTKVPNEDLKIALIETPALTMPDSQHLTNVSDLSFNETHDGEERGWQSELEAQEESQHFMDSNLEVDENNKEKADDQLQVEPSHVSDVDDDHSYFSQAEVVIPDEEKSYFGVDDFSAGASKKSDDEIVNGDTEKSSVGEVVSGDTEKSSVDEVVNIDAEKSSIDEKINVESRHDNEGSTEHSINIVPKNISQTINETLDVNPDISNLTHVDEVTSSLQTEPMTSPLTEESNFQIEEVTTMEPLENVSVENTSQSAFKGEVSNVKITGFFNNEGSAHVIDDRVDDEIVSSTVTFDEEIFHPSSHLDTNPDEEQQFPVTIEQLPDVETGSVTSFVGLVSKGSIHFDNVLPLSRRGRPTTDERTGFALPTPRKSDDAPNVSLPDEVTISSGIQVIPFLPEDAIQDVIRNDSLKTKMNSNSGIQELVTFSSVNTSDSLNVQVLSKNESSISVRLGTSSAVKVGDNEELHRFKGVAEPVPNENESVNNTTSTKVTIETSISSSLAVSTPIPEVTSSSDTINSTSIIPEILTTAFKRKEEKRIDLPLLQSPSLSTDGPHRITSNLDTSGVHRSQEYCVENGEVFQDGERIPTLDFCAQCKCSKGEIQCQHVACPRRPPGCIERILPSSCCPSFVCNETDLAMNGDQASNPNGHLPVRSGITIHGGFLPIERPIQHQPPIATNFDNQQDRHTSNEKPISNPSEDHQLPVTTERIIILTTPSSTTTTTEVVSVIVDDNNGAEDDDVKVPSFQSPTSLNEDDKVDTVKELERTSTTTSVEITTASSTTTLTTSLPSSTTTTTEMSTTTTPSTTTTSGGSWPVLKVSSCNIYGRVYRLGSTIGVLSGPCKECKCTATGVDCYRTKCF